MSRAAFFDALVSDSELNGFGFNSDTVFHTWSNEERPTNNTAFAILQWGTEAAPLWGGEIERGPRQLTVWVHFPKELTTDFDKVNVVLDRIDAVARELRDVVGEDSYTLSFVKVGGRSGDLLDDGFNTITRNGSYEIYQTGETP